MVFGFLYEIPWGGLHRVALKHSLALSLLVSLQSGGKRADREKLWWHGHQTGAVLLRVSPCFVCKCARVRTCTQTACVKLYFTIATEQLHCSILGVKCLAHGEFTHSIYKVKNKSTNWSTDDTHLYPWLGWYTCGGASVDCCWTPGRCGTHARQLHSEN